MSAHQVTALPSKATNVSLISREEARGLKVDVMTWTGRIFAYDEHRTSLRGDAKQIWDQIVALNPDYAKENGFEDPRTRDYTQYRPRFDINGVNDMDGTVSKPVRSQSCQGTPSLAFVAPLIDAFLTWNLG